MSTALAIELVQTTGVVPPPLPADFLLPWWLDLLTLVPLAIGVFVIVYFYRYSMTGHGFLRKQSDYLDHQRTVNERALEQNKAIEDMIAEQYRETNERADRALAQSDEAIRLHAAALAELTRMRETLSRLAGSLEAKGQP